MELNTREVMYGTYCKTCKHFEKEETDEICDECLEKFFREGSDIPENYDKRA